ncbi:MAG TPA: FtsX-like permease family protein [Candidatus Deferrimicrobium sp.]|nr:FtsX-like permease family protein [Candidatus Deferrimicrobium sp.]
MSYSKIGFRYLARRKIRTILTILAILLGVSILMGTSIASDSIHGSLNYQVEKKFGYTDFIILDQANPNYNWIPLDSIRNELNNVTGINFKWTYQMRQGCSVTPKDHNPIQSSYWWQFIGINASDPLESEFGSISINSSLNSNLTTIEEILTSPSFTNSCVITTYIAELCNLSVGQTLYVYPEDPWPRVRWQNSSTWFKLTIAAIVEDKGKSFAWFWPPFTDIWEVRPPEYAVYVDIEIAQKFIFNLYPDNVNLILIHAQNLNAIDSTMNTLLNAFKNSLDPTINSTEFYGFNLKSFFDNQISAMFNFFTAIFALFSGISLLICAILIKNLFEISKEEQIEEIGIMRAIGVSKVGIFRIYITQAAVISIIGSVLGLLCGYLVSFLFLGPLKYISLAVYPDIATIVGSEFEIIIVITSFALLMSFSTGIAVSMIFGMIPAISAANVNVLKALNPNLMEEK